MGILLSRGGWWGIAFVLGLFVEGTMVSLPTAAQTGERIKTFYEANRQVIVAQQVVGILLLAPSLGFALALSRRARLQRQPGARWLLPVGFFVLAAAELATNLPARPCGDVRPATRDIAHADDGRGSG